MISKGPAWVLAGAAAALAGSLAAAFTRWTAAAGCGAGGWAGGACGAARMVLAVAILFLLPGWAVLAACRLRAGLLEAAVLATLLGMALTAGAYWLLMRLGAGQAVAWLPALLGTGSAALLVALRRRGAAVLAGRPRPRWVHVWLAGVIAAALLPLFLRAGGFRDLALRADGGGGAGSGAELAVAVVPDMAFHLAYASELARAVPPQLPFAAGAAGSYHYGADLLAAALGRTMGVGIADLEVRFLPALWLALLAVAAFSCFRTVLRCGEAAAALAALLVIVGEDLSFLPGLAHGELGRGWSEAYFSTPTVHSLYNYNPMLPGLALLFAALLAIARWAGPPAAAGSVPPGVDNPPGAPGGGGPRAAGAWLPTIAVLLAAACACKVFAAALALAALAGVAVLRLARHRETRWLKLLGVAALAILPLLVGAWRGNQDRRGGPRIAVTLRSAPYVQQAVAAVGFAGTRPGRAILETAAGAAAAHDGSGKRRRIVHRAWTWLCFAVIGLPLFLAGSLGARLWGVPAAWRAAAGWAAATPAPAAPSGPRLLSCPSAPPATSGPPGLPDSPGPSAAHDPPASSAPYDPAAPGARQLIALMIGLGAVLTLSLDVSPRGLPAGAGYNESVWFYVVAKYLVWGFAVEGAWAWSRRSRKPGKPGWPGGQTSRFAAAAALMLALSVPGAVQLLASGWPPLRPAPHGFRQAADLLAAPCAAGAVVLAPEPLASLLVGVPGCRSPLALPPLQAASLGGAEIARRRDDLASFWQMANAGRLRADVLQRYQVGFLVASPAALGQIVSRRGGDTGGNGDGGAAPLPLRLRLRLLTPDLAVYEAAYGPAGGTVDEAVDSRPGGSS